MVRARSPLLILFLTVFIDMVAFGIVIPVLPLYAERFQVSPIAIGWLTGIYSDMQIIFTPVLGKLSDRFGRRPVRGRCWDLTTESRKKNQESELALQGLWKIVNSGIAPNDDREAALQIDLESGA